MPVVEVKDSEDGMEVEVRTELDYEGMTALAKELNPIVKKYDKDAYFDQYSSGVMVANIQGTVNEAEDDNEDGAEIELDDVELEEEPIEGEEAKEENHMEKFSAMVRLSLASEHETAAEYTKRAAKCEKHGMEDAAKLFRDIAEEEIVHAGEFQSLLEKYGLLNQEAIDQGEQEGNEILAGDKEEPEIDAPEVPADDMENESVNEDISDKGDLVYRIAAIKQYTTAEDHSAITLLRELSRYLDIDEFKGFYEYLMKEYDIDPREQFPGDYEDKEESVNEDAEFHVIQYNKKDSGYNPTTKYNCNSMAEVRGIFKGHSALNIVDKIEVFKGDKLVYIGTPEIKEGSKRYSVKWTKATASEDASSAGTVASLGAAPTAVVGKKPVEAKETRICEELKALQEALKG
jgi:rubrerythrin